MIADIPGELHNEGGPASDNRTNAGRHTIFEPGDARCAAPAKAGFQYIGMIARKRSNNDTAYFLEPGKQKPTSAALTIWSPAVS